MIALTSALVLLMAADGARAQPLPLELSADWDGRKCEIGSAVIVGVKNASDEDIYLPKLSSLGSGQAINVSFSFPDEQIFSTGRFLPYSTAEGVVESIRISPGETYKYRFVFEPSSDGHSTDPTANGYYKLLKSEGYMRFFYTYDDRYYSASRIISVDEMGSLPQSGKVWCNR